MRRQRPANARAHLQTAGRLGALRVRLTVLLLALNVVGLAGMGTVAMVVDGQQRTELVRAELRRTASTAVALLYYDSGALRLDNLFTDPTAQGPTAVYVYEATRSDVGLVFAHPAGLPVIPPDTLLTPALRVWQDGTEYAATVADSDGNQVHMLAVPFRHAITAAVAGTVVVVADPRPGQQAHQRLGVALFAGGAIFMLLAGIGGHLLARRGTRPAVQALGQQERFLADAAHEMRTPLTVIRALSEAALTDPARQPDALRQVLRSTERLTDAVEALLTRARLVAGLRELERQPFRLDQLAEEVVAETVQPPHTARVSAAPTVAYGDPTLVRIAIRNLVHNALQHGRVGDEPAMIRLLIGPGVFMIEDRGPGLGPEGDKEGGGQVDSARQRFRTGAPDGVGLGLAIAAWVAELHGGTLRLGRGPGGGTVAMLGLPEAVASKPSRPTGRKTSRRRLLHRLVR